MMQFIKRIARKRELAKLYSIMLAEAGNDPNLRMRKHIENLEEYWCRLLGACKVSFSSAFLGRSDFALSIEIASNSLASDLRQIAARHPNTNRLWLEYEQCWSEMKTNPDTLKDRAKNCYLKFLAFKQSFTNAEGRP
jgi:hypothetical protein